MTQEIIEVPNGITIEGVAVGDGGGAAAVVTYIMAATDPASPAGTKPSYWRSVGSPDMAGVGAPVFPHGDSWSSIWIAREL